MKNSKFLSASEVAREAGCSVGKVTAAVEAGILTPAGRSGTHATAAIIFERRDLETLLAALRFGTKAQASAKPAPHRCTSAADIVAKASALATAIRDRRK